MTDRRERFAAGSELYLSRRGGGDRLQVRIVSSRDVAKGLLVGFAGYDTRELAGKLAGAELFIPGEQLAEADPGAYYGFQLVGCRVFEAGDERGRVISLENPGTGANDYLVVVPAGGGSELCVPFIRDAILSIDLEGRRIDIREGFLG